MLEYYKQRLDMINWRIEKAALACNREPKEIKLIAVSKTHPVEMIQHFSELNQWAFGENRIQEMVSKWEAFPDERIEWHMIGGLQTNKIKYLAPRVNWIHSISKPAHLDELEKRLIKFERTVNILIQVNISHEDQKSGCEVEEIPLFFEKVMQSKWIHLRGFMGIASLEAEPEAVRPQFKALADVLHHYKKEYEHEHIHLTELSMGMSGDMEVAIEEGATMIRVGTALFGEREYPI